MMIRGVSGAITVDRDEREAILSATERLLKVIVAKNRIDTTKIVSALFYATPDLTTACPAAAARRMSWIFVPLFSLTDNGIHGGPPRCVRVLIHLNTDLRQDQIAHVFLEGARTLRSDVVTSCPQYVEDVRCFI